VIIINKNLKNFKNLTAIISAQKMWILFIFPDLVQNAETVEMDSTDFFLLTPYLGAPCDHRFESEDPEVA
jgi:hypothetical protein